MVSFILIQLLILFMLATGHSCDALSVINVINGFSCESGGYTYRVVHSYPHDRHALTQGLVLDDGSMYESTGRYGFSSLRRVEVETGKILQEHRLPGDLFGEGVTVFKDRIIQLTWKEQKGLVYQKESFEHVATFTYEHEGWGITHNGKELIVSDGTATIRFLDPQTYTEIRSIVVVDDEQQVPQLNELEYIDENIFANILGSDRIAIIDPRGGRVVNWLDLSSLAKEERALWKAKELNGIAYDPSENVLFVTGKNWSRVYEIELIGNREQDTGS